MPTFDALQCIITIFIFIIWFVRLLALCPIVPASGDSEDDRGEADGM
jgi:hypothetical protein